MIAEKEIKRYEKQIDEDFKTFPINKRLIHLEKAWIRNLSHKVMQGAKYFNHNDRKELKIKLFKYLNRKKKEADKRGTYGNKN